MLALILLLFGLSWVSIVAFLMADVSDPETWRNTFFRRLFILVAIPAWAQHLIFLHVYSLFWDDYEVPTMGEVVDYFLAVWDGPND